MEINSIKPNSTSFKASLNLIADKRCLPKGATKRLQKLAQTIGTNVDTITIGVYPETTTKTIVCKNLLGCLYKTRVIGSIDTYINTTATCPSIGFYTPLFVEKKIPGANYPDVVRKYYGSKEIKMNNYKEIYRYLLDVRDKFKPTV